MPHRLTCSCPSLRAPKSGRKKEVIDEEKQYMWEKQQEILRARREGRSLEGVKERREKARQAALEKEAKRRNDRAKVARGEALEDETSKPYGEKDKGLQGGIIIPLAPFGIPKYDQGERFDLKALYTDEGWVDESADPLKWAKGLFGGKKKAKASEASDAPTASGRSGRRSSQAAPESSPPQPKKRWPWSR